MDDGRFVDFPQGFDRFELFVWRAGVQHFQQRFDGFSPQRRNLMSFARRQNLQHPLGIRIGPPVEFFQTAGGDGAHLRIVVPQHGHQPVHRLRVPEFPQSFRRRRPGQRYRVAEHLDQRFRRTPVFKASQRPRGRATHAGVLILDGKNQRPDGIGVFRLRKFFDRRQAR